MQHDDLKNSYDWIQSKNFFSQAYWKKTDASQFRFLLGFFQWSQFHSFVEAFVQSSNQGRQAAVNVSLMASSRQWLVAAVRNPVEVTPNIPKCWFSKGTHPKMALNQGKDLW